MLYLYEKAFKIPCYFMADYTAAQLRRETDFINEAKNSERTAAYLADEPSLRNKVYVPKVHWEVTSSRVMTAEWVFLFSVSWVSFFLSQAKEQDGRSDELILLVLFFFFVFV